MNISINGRDVVIAEHRDIVVLLFFSDQPGLKGFEPSELVQILFAANLLPVGTNNIKPKDFPYAQAQRIYLEAGHDAGLSGALPMTETEFRTALDPVAIIENRATAGGPQASEMTRMLTAASQKLAEQDQWIMARRSRIDASLVKLDSDFARLAQK